MKNVGILTFHSAHNYGAVLQAYATQEIIKDLGCYAEIVDYRPDYLMQQHVFPILNDVPFGIKIKRLFEGIICIYWRYKRRLGFSNFIENRLSLSKIRYKNLLFSTKLDYDAFIMGSDQIWNIQVTKIFDNAYWGNFKTNNNALKITYAASMSNYSLNEIQKKEMDSLLRNFHFISVREDELKNYISENFKLDSVLVLDPTFLLTRYEWSKISKKPHRRLKYVLVYSVDLRNEVYKIARDVANQLGSKIIELTMDVDKNVLYNRFQSASPEEYLGLFENAECIITSSFHGTAFSIIYNKPFYCLAHGTDKDTRQKTILAKLGLLERLIPRDSTPSFIPIDYSEANEALEKLRKDSIGFLSYNLSNASY